MQCQGIDVPESLPKKEEEAQMKLQRLRSALSLEQAAQKRLQATLQMFKHATLAEQASRDSLVPALSLLHQSPMAKCYVRASARGSGTIITQFLDSLAGAQEPCGHGSKGSGCTPATATMDDESVKAYLPEAVTEDAEEEDVAKDVGSLHKGLEEVGYGLSVNSGPDAVAAVELGCSAVELPQVNSIAQWLFLDHPDVDLEAWANLSPLDAHRVLTDIRMVMASAENETEAHDLVHEVLSEHGLIR